MRIRRSKNIIFCTILFVFFVLTTALRISFAHPGHEHSHQKRGISKTRTTNAKSSLVALADVGAASAETKSTPKVSGQGKLRFKVLYTGDRLPKEAVQVLVRAHGGSAVDKREGKGEIYFALAGAGIIQVGGDLKTSRLIDTPLEMKNANMHDATVWYDAEGTPFLSFAANDIGKVFTTTLDGKLIHTLETPTAENDFDNPQVNDYFRKGGKFVPTDVDQLDNLFYIATGYSSLDYVLTAKIFTIKPFIAKWNDLAFGGKGTGMGQFGIGHGVTLTPDKKRIAISDRPNSKVERYDRYGRYRDTLQLPKGSLPCDIDYESNYAVVGCLDGPDKTKGAPIYILEGDNVISTIMPKEELGLEKFQHVHNAVLSEINGKLYIIAQTWNPGDFAILEQIE